MNADEWTGSRCITFANKALDVEVFVLHSQHFAFARFATVLTWDGAALPRALLLVKGTVNSLLVKRCGEREKGVRLIQKNSHMHTHTYCIYIELKSLNGYGCNNIIYYVLVLSKTCHFKSQMWTLTLLTIENNSAVRTILTGCSQKTWMTPELSFVIHLIRHLRLFVPGLHTYSITKACKLFIIQPKTQLEKDLQPLVLKGQVKLVSVGHPIPF